MKKAKTYNPLILDTKKDKPSFSDGQFNWWLIDVSKSKTYCAYFVKQIDCEHNEQYVLVDNKEHKLIFETNSLEAIGEHMALLDKAKENGWI